jgi:hypothetical protein
MGQRIDDENELATLREKARKWDLVVHFIEHLPDYQIWYERYVKEKK